MGSWTSLDHAGLLAGGHEEGGLEEASRSEQSLAGPRHLPRAWEQQVTGQCHVPSCCYNADSAEGPPHSCGFSCQALGRTPPPHRAHSMSARERRGAACGEDAVSRHICQPGGWTWGGGSSLTASTSSFFRPSSLSLARISSRCLSTTSFSFFITCRSRSDMPGAGWARPAGGPPTSLA